MTWMTLSNYWKSYHSLPHWMVFKQMFVSYKSVQYKRRTFAFLFSEQLYGKFQMSITFAYTECATRKWSLSIELAESFLLKYRYWTFANTTASALWKKFEHPASWRGEILMYAATAEKWCGENLFLAQITAFSVPQGGLMSNSLTTQSCLWGPWDTQLGRLFQSGQMTLHTVARASTWCLPAKIKPWSTVQEWYFQIDRYELEWVACESKLANITVC